MVFSSADFLFYFFPAFLRCYYALPWKNAVLLIASLVFYAWGEPRFVPLPMASAMLDYGFGRLVDAAATDGSAVHNGIKLGVQRLHPVPAAIDGRVNSR